MKKNLSLVTIVLSALVLSACASNKAATEQKIEKEIKEVPVQKTKSIDETVKEQIKASSLTQEQKDKLLALEEKAHAEREAITAEIEKTKVVMLETVLAPKMNEKEFSVLRNKIRSLDKQRMDNGFKTLREVRKIINPSKPTEHQEIYKAVIENRLRGF